MLIRFLFLDQMRNVSTSQTYRKLLAAEAEPVDPLRRHRVEIGRIGVSFLAAHEVGRRIRQGFVELAEIGKNEVLDRPPRRTVDRQIEMVRLTSLKKSRRNARTHSKKQIEQLMLAHLKTK
jgi:hypothetical protein